MKLNIGCGPNGQIDGFINIDNSKAALLARFPGLKKLTYRAGLINEDKFKANWDDVVWMDASRKLGYLDGTIDKIYSSHFLEHIPRENGRRVLQECYRVLKPGSPLRLVLPDLLWHIRRYEKETEEMLSIGTKAFSTKAHDKLLDTIYGAYLNPARFGLHHCYMYDFPTLYSILSDIGFRDIQQFPFRHGRDDDLCKHDNRPEDSMHIECIK